MWFKLETVCDVYPLHEGCRRDLEAIEKLKGLGFEFDGCMRLDRDLEINISTIEELVEFIKKYGEIIMFENKILIYDDSYE